MKPSDRASELMDRIDHAHARLRRAWRSRPDGDLQTGRPTTGRVTSSRIPDPASDAAATLERLRADVLATVCELTAELAETDAVATDPSPVFRSRRLTDVLTLHRQYAGQLFGRIRTLEQDPTGWDDAKSLTSTLAAHTQQIHRTSLWAHGRLAQPDAPPGLRVCDDDHCQSPAHQDSLWCPTHKAREERRQAMHEQRRRQVAADRANGLRCHGEIRDCEQMLSDRDRRRGRRNCSQCRRHAQRPVDDDGWPLCASDHRPCGRRLGVEDAAAGQRNCSACRAHDVRNPDAVRQHVEANGR